MIKSKKSLLEIAELGEPVLRKKALKIINIKDKETKNLIDDLITIVKEVEGVGISAPQLGKSIRLFILASHPNSRYPNAPLMEPIAILNPEIISMTGTKEKDWEGCLSIPGIRALVPRYKKIIVKYTGRDGISVKKSFAGFIARIFQHEYDHLEGIVFLDRIENTQEVITEKEYQKIMEKKI